MTIKEYLVVNIRGANPSNANMLIGEYARRGWRVHSLASDLDWVLLEMDVEPDGGDNA